MKLETALAFIAQGVINIDEGIDVIRKDSLIYNAMKAILEHHKK